MGERTDQHDGEAPEALTLGEALSSEGYQHADQDFETAADRALRERPRFNMRLQLILAFSLFFLLPLVITLWAMSVLAEVDRKVLFLEVADDFKLELQQARRFEKNFLLYGTNLPEAREHAQAALDLMTTHVDRFLGVIGEEANRSMHEHVVDYLGLLDTLGSGDRADSEEALRIHGAKMLKMAQELLDKERDLVRSRLTLARRVPFYFLGVVLVLMVVVVSFLARHILSALKRFMEYAQRIADGDFTPITPARRYRDEFSDLALVINKMVRDLDRHHTILMESHKLRAMGNLVAGVAHEINNPLNNILLTASLLKEDLADAANPEQREMLDDVISQAERSSRIVANLLDFARESGAQLEPIDLRSLLEETQRLVGNQIRVKKVRLELELPDALPAVHADRQLLSQVFLNLILNALDVLPEKGRIQIVQSDQPREGFLGVSVVDDGPGIPGHVLNQIFDPFFTTKPKGKGTGLGLAVSRGIVRKLGGYLTVRSIPGEGSTFTVYLPVTSIPSALTAGAKPDRLIAAEPAEGEGS